MTLTKIYVDAPQGDDVHALRRQLARICATHDLYFRPDDEYLNACVFKRGIHLLTSARDARHEGVIGLAPWFRLFSRRSDLAREIGPIGYNVVGGVGRSPKKRARTQSVGHRVLLRKAATNATNT